MVSPEGTSCRTLGWQPASIDGFCYDVDNDYKGVTAECNGLDEWSQDSASIYIDENGASIKLDNETNLASEVYINKYGQVFLLSGDDDGLIINRAIDVLKCAKQRANPEEKEALDRDIAILVGIQICATGPIGCGPDLDFLQLSLTPCGHGSAMLCSDGMVSNSCTHYLTPTGVIADRPGNTVLDEDSRDRLSFVSQKVDENLRRNPDNALLQGLKGFLDSAVAEDGLLPDDQFPYQIK